MDEKMLEDKGLMSSDSVLNVKAQERLFDYRMKAMTRFTIKLYLIVLPLILVIIFGSIFLAVYFLRK